MNTNLIILTLGLNLFAGCTDMHGKQGGEKVPDEVSADAQGVDASLYTAANCFQDMGPLGYPYFVGMPTTMFDYGTEGACYGGLNSEGGNDDWNRPGNTCADAGGDVKVVETGVTFVITELDPGVDLSGSWYEGNWYNHADPTCDPSNKGSSCWAITQNCNVSQWISTYIDTQGTVVSNFSANSTQDGLIGKGDLANGTYYSLSEN